MSLPQLQSLDSSVELDRMVENAREASEFLKALAQELRLLIFCILSGGEKSVGELEEFLSQRQSTVSQQLARLRLENLVTTRREGKTIYYSLAGDKVRTIFSTRSRRLLHARPTGQGLICLARERFAGSRRRSSGPSGHLLPQAGEGERRPWISPCA